MLSTSVVSSIAVVMHVAAGGFVDRGAGVGGQDFFVVDRRDRDVERAAAAGACSIVDAEVERVADRLAAVVVVGHQAGVDVGLGEGVTDAQGGAAEAAACRCRSPS